MIVSLYLVLLEILIVNGGVSYLPSSTLSYKEIENKIRGGISKATLTQEEENLIAIAAQERYDHQKTKYDLEAAENKTEYEHDRAIGAEKDKNNIAFQLKVPLTARTRIEILTGKDYFPTNMRKPESIREQIIIVLKSGNPKVRKLYDEVLKLYDPKDAEKSIQMFAEACERIYGGTSNIAAHNVMDSNLLKLFGTGSEETLEKFLDLCNVPNDEKYVKALRAISVKLPIPKDQDIYEGTLNTYTCIEIKPTTKKESHVAIFDKTVVTSDVYAFFPTIKTDTTKGKTDIKGVTFNSNSENTGILSIVVEFEDTNKAIIAFDENHGWLKQRRAALRIISCPKTQQQHPTTVDSAPHSPGKTADTLTHVAGSPQGSP